MYLYLNICLYSTLNFLRYFDLKYILSIFFYGIYFISYSQVDDIKKRAAENQRDGAYTPAPSPTPVRPSPSSGSGNNRYYNNNTNSNLNVGEIAACFGCFDFSSGFIHSITQHHQYLRSRDEDNFRLFSAEVFGMGGFTNKEAILLLPRFRLNLGVFATDFRYTNLIEKGKGNYDTFDWQALLINLFSRKQFYLRVGTGFMYEPYTGSFFNEHSLSSDVVFEKRWGGNFELRLSHDKKTQIFPRTEAGFRVNYILANSKNLQTSFTFGILYQNYYQAIKVISLQGGVVLMIH